MFKKYLVTYAFLKEAKHSPVGLLLGKRPLENCIINLVPALGSYEIVKDGVTFYMDREKVDTFQLAPIEEPPGPPKRKK